MSELDSILADIKTGEAINAARRDWNPHYQGEIDIRIAADGSWFHQQRPFQRDSLVKLFAGILRREDALASASSPIISMRSGLKWTLTAIHPDLMYTFAMVSTR
jgi:hypothetical protein